MCVREMLCCSIRKFIKNLTKPLGVDILRESYGAHRQQHTFTVEVLWSKGVNKLPALHPLLIKGRNLYKMKTFRQRCKDESQRAKVLEEKHRRGDAARSVRETRWAKSAMRKQSASNHSNGKKCQKKNEHAQKVKACVEGGMQANESRNSAKRKKYVSRKLCCLCFVLHQDFMNMRDREILITQSVLNHTCNSVVVRFTGHCRSLPFCGQLLFATRSLSSVLWMTKDGCLMSLVLPGWRNTGTSITFRSIVQSLLVFKP